MSGIWHMFCISKTRADRGKLVLFLESVGQIYPETGLTFEAPKCVLASVISLYIVTWSCILISRCDHVPSYIRISSPVSSLATTKASVLFFIVRTLLPNISSSA